MKMIFGIKSKKELKEEIKVMKAFIDSRNEHHLRRATFLGRIQDILEGPKISKLKIKEIDEAFNYYMEVFRQPS